MTPKDQAELALAKETLRTAVPGSVHHNWALAVVDHYRPNTERENFAPASHGANPPPPSFSPLPPAPPPPNPNAPGATSHYPPKPPDDPNQFSEAAERSIANWQNPRTRPVPTGTNVPPPPQGQKSFSFYPLAGTNVRAVSMNGHDVVQISVPPTGPLAINPDDVCRVICNWLEGGK